VYDEALPFGETAPGHVNKFRSSDHRDPGISVWRQASKQSRPGKYMPMEVQAMARRRNAGYERMVELCNMDSDGDF
jgi:hypothetical protein